MGKHRDRGFYWWELDLTWLGLRLLAALGVVSDLKPVPAHVLDVPRAPGPKGAGA